MTMRRQGMWLTLGVLGTLLAGCESPTARERLAHRQANLERTAEQIGESLGGDAKSLAKTAGVLAERHQRDIARCNENVGKVETWYREEFEGWEEHLPYHERWIGRQMKGDVPNIERTVPLMLY